MAQRYRYSDIDLNFTPHPATGDVSLKYDENAVKTSIKNLVLTRNFERPFNSQIGTQIKNMLFENFNPLTEATLKRMIEDTIINYEPRAELISVKVLVSPDNNSAMITITFKLVNTSIPVDVNLTIERTR